MTHGMPTPQTRRSSRWLWIVLGGLILATIVFRGTSFFGGTSDPGPPAVGVTEVAVHDNDFVPAAIEVADGTTVTWLWEGENSHNVVGETFESPVQERGEFVHTFTEPGVYDYRCTLHGGMRGEVVVTEASA